MRVGGVIRVPGDKSISHRSLLFAALASGESRIRNILPSADVHSTAGVLRTLGVAVPELAADLRVPGVGLHGLRAPESDLDCGNSGTTTRLVSGIAAAQPFRSRFVGDASLSRRPMQRVARPLSAMGARFEFERGDGLPMIVHGGALRSIEWRSETASAQVKSAILLAALCAGVPATVHEPGRSRDHTERMLTAMGVTVRAGGSESEPELSLEPASRLEPLDFTVPADPSSAAFFAALAVLADEGSLVIRDVGLNPTRSGFFAALARMGGDVQCELGPDQGGESSGSVRASASELHGAEIGGAEVPSMIDELPLLACVAVRARGTTRITGAAELRVKESDRIALTVENLRALGVAAEELPDGMVVEGGSQPLAGRVRTGGDHRLAMAFGVLGALDGSRIEIDEPECVAVSYPGFWRDLERAVSGR